MTELYKSLKMEVSFSVKDHHDENELRRVIEGVAADLAIKLRGHQGSVMFSWPAETVIVLKSPSPGMDHD